MARDLGWGGIANTNGPRSFAGKAAAAVFTPEGASERHALVGRARVRARDMWWILGNTYW